jgi:hypothetical protein
VSLDLSCSINSKLTITTPFLTTYPSLTPTLDEEEAVTAQHSEKKVKQTLRRLILKPTAQQSSNPRAPAAGII